MLTSESKQVVDAKGPLSILAGFVTVLLPDVFFNLCVCIVIKTEEPSFTMSVCMKRKLCDSYHTSKYGILCLFGLQILHSNIQSFQSELSEGEHFS